VTAALKGTVPPTNRRTLCVFTGVLVLSLSQSGCTFGADDANSPAPTAMTPPEASASPTPQPTVTPPALDVGTVVATGTLVGDDRVSGDVDVRVIGKDTFEVRLINFRSEYDGDVELLVSPHVVEPGTACTSSIMAMSYGTLEETHPTYPLLKDFTHGDPSFLDTVIIVHPAARVDGCVVPVLSSAILDWKLPDMRPGLVVSDSGKTGGAQGEITLLDATPLTYTVAADDLAPEVAARFGITVKDLFYLNPIRTTHIRYPLLQAGEVLNLSKTHR
jgi:hypothetical protein